MNNQQDLNEKRMQQKLFDALNEKDREGVEELVEHRFSAHGVDEETHNAMAVVRGTFRRLVSLLGAVVPQSRERAVMLTKLEEAMFWANAGLARKNNEPLPMGADLRRYAEKAYKAHAGPHDNAKGE